MFSSTTFLARKCASSDIFFVHDGIFIVILFTFCVSNIACFNIKDQCNQCLQSISSKLDSLKLNWNDVIKMNVMIVSGKFKASTVRKMLDEYIPGSIPTLSIAYVMELEKRTFRH
jgi:enamine deaminase RidA (YjgF/YER057c/UK114 family)